MTFASVWAVRLFNRRKIVGPCMIIIIDIIHPLPHPCSITCFKSYNVCQLAITWTLAFLLLSQSIMEIQVTLLLGGRIPRLEKNALVEHGVQKNWISQQLVQEYRLKIQKLPRDIASESWNERQLQALGLITLAWRRREGQTPMVFESQFHVSADDSIPILIGHELLSEQPKIENPSDGMLVNVLGRKSKSNSFPYRYFNIAL